MALLISAVLFFLTFLLLLSTLANQRRRERLVASRLQGEQVREPRPNGWLQELGSSSLAQRAVNLDSESRLLLDRIEREKIKGTVAITRFKGLGEMNPSQLRESTIHPDTRRLVQLTNDDDLQTRGLMDMLLAKKRAADRKAWLEQKGDLATLEV